MDFVTAGVGATLLFIALVLAKVVDMFLLPKIKVNGASEEDRRVKLSDTSTKIDALEAKMSAHMSGCSGCHERIRKIETMVCKVDPDGLPMVYNNRSANKESLDILRGVDKSLAKLTDLTEVLVGVLNEARKKD